MGRPSLFSAGGLGGDNDARTSHRLPSVGVSATQPYLHEPGAPSARLRIAYATGPRLGAASETASVPAIERTVHQLAAMGHDVVEDEPLFDWNRFLDTMHVLWCAGIASFVDAVAAGLGRTPSPENLEATTRA